MYRCPTCFLTYGDSSSLLRHFRTSTCSPVPIDDCLIPPPLAGSGSQCDPSLLAHEESILALFPPVAYAPLLSDHSTEHIWSPPPSPPPYHPTEHGQSPIMPLVDSLPSDNTTTLLHLRDAVHPAYYLLLDEGESSSSSLSSVDGLQDEDSSVTEHDDNVPETYSPSNAVSSTNIPDISFEDWCRSDTAFLPPHLVPNEDPALLYPATPPKVHPVEEELMSILVSNHLPKSMYSTFMNWARYASNVYPDYTFDGPIYETVLRRMKEYYNITAGGPPLSEIIPVGPNHPPVHVYRFDFLSQARRIFRNKSLMAGSLWHFKRVTNAAGERVYSELNTADFWESADAYVTERVKCLPRERRDLPHLIAPVTLFVDGTLCDKVGRLTAEPVLASVGNVPGEMRRSPLAWFLLGFIPPYPKTPKERAYDRDHVATEHQYTQYYHSCLKSVLQDLLKLDNYSGGTKVYVVNRGYVYLHFKVAMIIGDTEGHDKLCCHYMAYSASIQRCSRDCDCPSRLADDLDFECTPTKVAKMKSVILPAIAAIDAGVHGTVKEARNALATVSSYGVRPAFWDFDFAGCELGIYGSCPFELLHWWDLGILKYLLDSIFEMADLPIDFLRWYQSNPRNPEQKPPLGQSPKKQLPKAEFERRFRILTSTSRRQSDRDMPKTPFKNGVTELTRLNAQEYPGLCMLTMVALKGLLHPKKKNKPKQLEDQSERDYAISLSKHKSEYRKAKVESEKKETAYIQLIFRALSLHQMMQSEKISSSQIETLQMRMRIFLSQFKELVGPHRESVSKVGLCTVKFHASLHIAKRYICHYGSTLNFFGGPLEHCLIPYVKSPSKRTSRQQGKLGHELMRRRHEIQVVEESRLLRKDVMDSIYSSFSKPSSKRKRGDEVVGSDTADNMDQVPTGFRVHCSQFHATKNSSNGTWSTFRGKDVFAGVAKHPYFEGEKGDDWVHAMLEKADSLGRSEVRFSFGCDVPNESGGCHDIFRCHPDYHSYPYLRRSWHDWAMVSWTQGSEISENAAKILVWGEIPRGTAQESESEGSEEEDGEGELFCVVDPLSRWSPNPDASLFFGTSDHLTGNPVVVSAFAIASVAFVLPCVDNRTDSFPESIEDAKHFIVFPPRASWVRIGWS